MDRADLLAYLDRDRGAVEALRLLHWQQERVTRGPAWALELADDLRRRYCRMHPDWPTETDRAADLEVHIRVGEALRSVATRHGA